MRIRYLPFFAQTFALFVGLAFALSAQAQSSRSPGWEFRADLLYQNSKDVSATGGTVVNLHTGWGGSLGAGYRFSPFAEVHLLFDFQSMDYDGTFVRADIPNISVNVSGGRVDVSTPRVVGVFNFMDNPITPFVSGSVGWAFTHATDPLGRSQSACWWDPWYGYICGNYPATFSNDHLTYDVGVGVRWDISDTFGMRLAYEKHWIELSSAAGTPGFDVLRLGFQFSY